MFFGAGVLSEGCHDPTDGQQFAEVDCHSSVAASLRRLLIRHKLRQPLAIEDVSAGGMVAGAGGLAAFHWKITSFSVIQENRVNPGGDIPGCRE